MYLDAIAGPHRDDADLVGLVEPNPGRLAVQLKRLAAAGVDTGAIVTGVPDDLEAVLSKTGADRLVVTSPDYAHADLIGAGPGRRRRRGRREAADHRPAEHPQDRRGRRAVGRQVVVTHNYRYSPRNSGLKQIVKSGAIGTPLSVTFEWVLDTARRETTSAAGTGTRRTPAVC